MRGTADRVSAVLDLLRDIGDPMPSHRMAKCQSLYLLASRIGNTIVELGTYHGTGAIALALGARDHGEGQVWTVDDYAGRRGWAGEPYVRADKLVFEQRVHAAGVDDIIQHIQRPVREAAQAWEGGRIHLLFWDLGIQDRIEGDFDAWAPHLGAGSIFAIHDTRQGTLGSLPLVERLAASGDWVDSGLMQGDVRPLVRKRP